MNWVPGEQHLADHLTKGKSRCEIDELIRGVGGQMTLSVSDRERAQMEEATQKKRYCLRAIDFARGGTCERREESKRPAGCPTSAEEQVRCINAGGVLVYEVGHPTVVCQAAIAV